MTDRFLFSRAWPVCGALVLGLAGCAAPGAPSATAVNVPQNVSPASAPAPAPTASAPVAAPTPPASTAASPAPDAAQAQAFAQWVMQFRDEARAAGIGDSTLHSAFDGV